MKQGVWNWSIDYCDFCPQLTEKSAVAVIYHRGFHIFMLFLLFRGFMG